MLRLQSVSVESVLRRGFAWASKRTRTKPVYNLEQARQTHNFEIQFYDGCWRSENGFRLRKAKTRPLLAKKPSNRGKPMNCKSICLTISLFCFFSSLAPAQALQLCGKAKQGEILVGHADKGESIVFNKQKLRMSPSGEFLLLLAAMTKRPSTSPSPIPKIQAIALSWKSLPPPGTFKTSKAFLRVR